MMEYRNLFDVLDAEEFMTALGGGFIRVQTHPLNEGWRIFNYTEKATFERYWNRSTRLCRGLIVDADNNIRAMPFSKFHNSNEPEAATFSTTHRVNVFDKVDGSMGIFYFGPDGLPAIATRGSFASDQAVHATHVLRTKYGQWASSYADLNITPIFEIVYPENRIVLKYDFDDLVLLGAVGHHTGGVYDTELIDWPGPKVEIIAWGIFLKDALSLPNRENKEGMVLRSWSQWDLPSVFDQQIQVKIKQDDYIALHKIVTNLTDRAIWELGPNADVSEFISVLPDEFHVWARDTYSQLWRKFQYHKLVLTTTFEHILRKMPEGWTRKDFALYVKDSPDKGYYFSLLDGRSIDEKIWQEFKPEAQDKLGIDLESV